MAKKSSSVWQCLSCRYAGDEFAFCFITASATRHIGTFVEIATICPKCRASALYPVGMAETTGSYSAVARLDKEAT